jgi:hypothetical protein
VSPNCIDPIASVDVACSTLLCCMDCDSVLCRPTTTGDGSEHGRDDDGCSVVVNPISVLGVRFGSSTLGTIKDDTCVVFHGNKDGSVHIGGDRASCCCSAFLAWGGDSEHTVEYTSSVVLSRYGVFMVYNREGDCDVSIVWTCGGVDAVFVVTVLLDCSVLPLLADTGESSTLEVVQL